MPEFSLSPPTRFLLRGSVLLASLLTLWWLVLINPLQFLLRIATEAGGALVFDGHSSLTITDAANGDWTFEVPIEPIVPPTPPGQTPRQIYSIDFDLARPDAIGFTFGLPVFWALMLAGPHLRRNLRPLFAGTFAMGVLEVALLLTTVKILAYKSLAQILQSHDPVQVWFLRFGEYLAVNAIPYLLPFVVAITLHRELREQMFQWAPPTSPLADGTNSVRRADRRRLAAKRP